MANIDIRLNFPAIPWKIIKNLVHERVSHKYIKTGDLRFVSLENMSESDTILLEVTGCPYYDHMFDTFLDKLVDDEKIFEDNDGYIPGIELEIVDFIDIFMSAEDIACINSEALDENGEINIEFIATKLAPICENIYNNLPEDMREQLLLDGTDGSVVYFIYCNIFSESYEFTDENISIGFYI